MPRITETLDDDDLSEDASTAAVPGLVLVFAAERAAMAPVRLDGAPIEIGREGVGTVTLDDDRMSRRHASVHFDGQQWAVQDLESRNGTFVDGERITGRVTATAPRCIRTGRSLFLCVRDVRPFERHGVQVDASAVLGPAMLETFDAIGRAAAAGDALLIRGESGTGKELAARAFHAKGPRPAGPFVAVNCAAIPEGVAERLLFGAKRGTYSGAASDADGYLQEADGGTLFLDEIAELEMSVQAKLLRVLESKEVLALGASRARTVDVRVCSATHNDLRGDVAAGRFREDLYFRVGRPDVHLAPLRERTEEIPWLVAQALKHTGAGLSPHSSLIEACLVRAWPGNVRELLNEVRAAGRTAIAAGRTAVGSKDLGETAGLGIIASKSAAETTVNAPTREAIEDALRREKGNVTRTAKALGMHRTQLRRWLEKHGIKGDES